MIKTVYIISLAVCLFFTTGLIRPLSASDDDAGIVMLVTGRPQIKAGGAGPWKALTLRAKVSEKDIIKTDAKSSVKIRLKNNVIADIKPGEEIIVDSLIKKPARVQGSLKNIFGKVARGTEHHIGVTAVVGVRGDDVSQKQLKIKPAELLWDTE